MLLHWNKYFSCPIISFVQYLLQYYVEAKIKEEAEK